MTTAGPIGARLKGQEISIRVLQGPTPLATLNSISTFNDETAFKLLEDGFLGEPVNRFDEVLDGYGGDFEMQVTDSGWVEWQRAIISRATRENPGITFNIVRTDLFANGSSIVWTYQNVSWGAMPQKVGGRGEYVKVSANFKCSQRPIQRNQI